MNATTNPLLLTLLAAGLLAVMLLRRTDAPWARSMSTYFALAAAILAIRLVFQVLVGTSIGTTVLITLPQVSLPVWAQGIRIGGPVTAEGLLWTSYDALRLAVLLLCLGAANTLANPRDALRSVPAALYEASVAVVIALSVTPQLIESATRVRRARRLRGDVTGGLRSVTTLAIPVIADAIDRSVDLAAGMEARGFARTAGRPRRGLLLLTLAAAGLTVFGVFELLSDQPLLGAGCLLAGVVGSIAGLRLAGRRLAVTRYRPRPWTILDGAIAGSGVAVAVVVVTLATLDAGVVVPPIEPLAWPPLHPLMLVAAALTLAPLTLTSAPTAAVVPTDGPATAVRPLLDRLRPKVAAP